jgi:hypothetical protein
VAATGRAEPVSGRTSTRLAWALLGVVVGLELALLGMGVAARHSTMGGVVSTVVGLLVFGAFAVVGAVVAAHRPENPIGWLFCAAAICMLLANVSGGYADLASRRGLPAAVDVAVAASWTWILGIGLLVPIVLVFPDGRPLEWARPYVRPVVVAWLGVLVVASIVAPGELLPARGAKPAVENPVAAPGLSAVLHGFAVAGGVALIALSVASLVIRWRRAGDERRQISWFLLSVAIVVAAILVSNVVNMPDAFWFPIWATIPVTIGIAVLRYRLYEIDVIVRRTLIYGAVSALLAACYFGIVVALQGAFGSITQGNELAVACSTLAVAALFRPLRRRVQTIVDRRFYRSKVDAEATLARFGARLRHEADLDTLLAELHAVVGQTLAPEHVSLWLRADDRNDLGTVAQYKGAR